MVRYINMLINIVIFRFMTLVINKGINAATKGRKSRKIKKFLPDRRNA